MSGHTHVASYLIGLGANTNLADSSGSFLMLVKYICTAKQKLNIVVTKLCKIMCSLYYRFDYIKQNVNGVTIHA